MKDKLHALLILLSGVPAAKMEFQDQLFSKFQDIFTVSKISTNTNLLRVIWHKSVINIREAVIYYNITSKVNEITVTSCIRI